MQNLRVWNISTKYCNIDVWDKNHRQIDASTTFWKIRKKQPFNSPPVHPYILFSSTFQNILLYDVPFFFPHFIFITFEINWGRLSSDVISVVASQYNWIDGRLRPHFETLPWVKHRLDFSQFNLEIPIQLTFSNFQIRAFCTKLDSFIVDNEILSWPVSSKIILYYIL